MAQTNGVLGRTENPIPGIVQEVAGKPLSMRCGEFSSGWKAKVPHSHSLSQQLGSVALVRFSGNIDLKGSETQAGQSPYQSP